MRNHSSVEIKLVLLLRIILTLIIVRLLGRSLLILRSITAYVIYRLLRIRLLLRINVLRILLSIPGLRINRLILFRKFAARVEILIIAARKIKSSSRLKTSVVVKNFSLFIVIISSVHIYLLNIGNRIISFAENYSAQPNLRRSSEFYSHLKVVSHSA